MSSGFKPYSYFLSGIERLEDRKKFLKSIIIVFEGKRIDNKLACFSSDETVVFEFGNVDADKVHDKYLLKCNSALLFIHKDSDHVFT